MIRNVGIEGLKNYKLDTEAKVIQSPYSPIVNRMGFVKENVLCTVVKAGELQVGEISLDESLTYKTEIVLDKSDISFDIKKQGVKYIKEYHIQKAYHIALASKLNAITGTATSLIELLSKAPVYEAVLFVSLEDYKTIQAFTPSDTPLGLSKLEVLVIEGLQKPCIASLEEIAGKCIIDFKEAEQDTDMTRQGKEKWFLDIYLGVELLGNIIK